MPKRKDVLKGSPRIQNDLGRRVKIEAWKNFIEFRNEEFPFNASEKRDIMNYLEIFLNRTVDNINFSFRNICRHNFICKKSKYNFLGQDIDTWLVRLIITSEDFSGLDFKLPREFKLAINIFMDTTAFHNSEWNVIDEKE